MKIQIVNRCIWCEEGQLPMLTDKMICSMKCLKEMIKTWEEPYGKDTCSFDKSDVYIKKTKRKA